MGWAGVKYRMKKKRRRRRRKKDSTEVTENDQDKD